MKKVKTFVEYEELAHRAVMYPSDEVIGYLAGELLKQAEEIAKEAKDLAKYNKDVKYEVVQEKLGKILLYLTELSKYAVYLDNNASHTPNSALEYIARKSLNMPFIKMEEMR